MPDITGSPLTHTNAPRKVASPRAPVRSASAIHHLPATIHSLPEEILLLVFLHTVRTWDKHCAPWVIAFVCKQWREIALSCSRLWMNVKFRLGHEWRLEEAEREYTFMLLQLDRALSRDVDDHMPLDLEVGLPIRSPPTNVAAAIHGCIERCFTEILTRVRFFCSLTLSGPAEEFLPFSISFQVPEARYSGALSQGHNLLLDSRFWEGTSHTLRRLSLTNITFLQHPNPTPTCLPQLTSLEISYPDNNGSPAFLIRFLAGTPCLEELSIRLDYYDEDMIEHDGFWPETIGLPTVELRNLKTFGFDGTTSAGTETMAEFFCVLTKFCTAPSLETLRLQNFSISDQKDLLRAHLQSPGHIDCAKSLISISVIECQFFEFTGEGILQSLDWCTSLEELDVGSDNNFIHMSDPDRIDPLLRALSSRKGASLIVYGLESRVLCPRLRRLALTDCSLEPRLIGRLVSMRALDDASDSPTLDGCSALEVLRLKDPTLIIGYRLVDGRDFLEKQIGELLLQLELEGKVHTTLKPEKWSDSDSEVDDFDL